MKAVIPAAGQGTRLRPLTDSKPKGLVEVADKPLLAHAFDSLSQLGVSELIVVIGYQGEAIVECFGDTYDGIPITYAEQAAPAGLADAVLCAEPYIEHDFLVHHGDNIFDANLKEARDRHIQTAPAVTILVEKVSQEVATSTGICKVDSSGTIQGFVEKPDKPPSRLAITGFFAFSPRIFHACELVTPSERGEYELTDAIDLLLHAGHSVEKIELAGWRVNVNTQADRESVAARLS